MTSSHSRLKLSHTATSLAILVGIALVHRLQPRLPDHLLDELGERMSFDCEDRRLAGRRAKPVEQSYESADGCRRT